MIKLIQPGTEFFNEYSNNNLFYIDKTPFIKNVFKEGQGKVFLITRPRRFGKTLKMSTFYEFLRINPKDPNNAEDTSYQEALFKDTKIFEDKEFCSEYMGKFPVIFITLKSVEGPTYEKAFLKLGSIIKEVIENNFLYLFNSEKLLESEKEKLKKISSENYFSNDWLNAIRNKELISSLNIDQAETIEENLQNSLTFLTKCLSNHHGVNPIVLIDEYDVPFSKARAYGYYDEIKSLMSGLLGKLLKTNSYLGKAVLTGCLRAAKESIFTGLNNFVLNTVQSDDFELSQAIGFTETEVNQVLDYYNLSDYKNMVKENYNGYYFGEVTMYCPWDVMNFCNNNYKKILNKTNQRILADNHWINSSSNDIIKEFMGFISTEAIDKMQQLVDGESIIATIKDSLCYGDLDSHSEDDFWTLLLYTGYLTINPNYKSDKKYEYELRIPNSEIRECFNEKILEYFSTNPNMQNHANDFIKALFNGDNKTVEQNLTALLKKYVSIRDFATKAPAENYYHGFLNGLLIERADIIKTHVSNVESGDGYVDLILESLDGKTAVVIEIKQSKERKDSKIEVCQKALEQIKEKHYADEYISNLDYKSVYIYGMCFHKKLCSVLVEQVK